ncbi:MAG: SDR family oxidoreductase [Betaproteobacteria bacterium]|jgi:3-oxoacyl-[acyl-carrier protein] reductase
MDLGIRGRKAIICASSRGLGKACALSLSKEGVIVYLNGRHQDDLDIAAQEIQEMTKTEVHTVLADITTEDGRQKLIRACNEVDILVTNNAGPTPGQFLDWAREDYLAAFESNMLAPVLMIRGVLAGMQKRKFGRIINITSAMVKAPNPHQGLSTAARTALTAVCKAISRDVAVDNVTINNLLPERIDTGRQIQMTQRQAKIENISFIQARAKLESTIAAKRFGKTEEFGDMCAYLCSQQASFISGQNIQIDGGSYRGLI